MPLLRKKKPQKPEVTIKEKVREVLEKMKNPAKMSEILDRYEEFLTEIANSAKSISDYSDKVRLQNEIEKLFTVELESLRGNIDIISREIKGLNQRLKLVDPKSMEALRIKRRITRLGLHLKILKHQIDAIQRVLDDVKEAISGMPLTFEALQQLNQYQQMMVQLDQMQMGLAEQVDQFLAEQAELYDKGVQMALQEVGELAPEYAEQVSSEAERREMLKKLAEDEEKGGA